jgi:hypothetical protein
MLQHRAGRSRLICGWIPAILRFFVFSSVSPQTNAMRREGFLGIHEPTLCNLDAGCAPWSLRGRKGSEGKRLATWEVILRNDPNNCKASGEMCSRYSCVQFLSETFLVPTKVSRVSRLRCGHKRARMFTCQLDSYQHFAVIQRKIISRS